MTGLERTAAAPAVARRRLGVDPKQPFAQLTFANSQFACATSGREAPTRGLFREGGQVSSGGIEFSEAPDDPSGCR